MERSKRGRSPYGERGLKFQRGAVRTLVDRRSPYGVRELKSVYLRQRRVR